MSSYVNSVTYGLFHSLSSSSLLVNSGVNVCVNNILNTDPNLTPWVGVYSFDFNIEPVRISRTTPYKYVFTSVVYVQAASMESSDAAVEELDKATNIVITSVLSNNTLLDSVDFIRNISASPFDRDLNDEQWMFSNEITIESERNV